MRAARAGPATIQLNCGLMVKHYGIRSPKILIIISPPLLERTYEQMQLIVQASQSPNHRARIQNSTDQEHYLLRTHSGLRTNTVILVQSYLAL